ncbi:serine/threonine protein phosphatase PP2A-2 catalytic subunit, putative, partial [Entamoeba invadens IP1]
MTLDLSKVNGHFDLKLLREHFMKGGLVSENTLSTLIESAKIIFKTEKNVINVNKNTSVFGDIHGQYFDLLSELDEVFVNYYNNHIFLGDYVDRGEYSCEVLITLLCLKMNNPNSVIMLRGNHESDMMCSSYGFKSECIWKYGDAIYNQFLLLF